MIAPVIGYPVSQWFGEDPGAYPEYGGHPGIDYACPMGTSVAAPAAGVIILAGRDPAYPGRGLHVVIDHRNGLASYLMHLSAVSVQAGDGLNQGEAVGLSGSTGWSTGPHLHWGVRCDCSDEPQDHQEHQGFLDPMIVLQRALSAGAAERSALLILLGVIWGNAEQRVAYRRQPKQAEREIKDAVIGIKGGLGLD